MPGLLTRGDGKPFPAFHVHAQPAIAYAVMHAGIANPRWRETVPGIPCACAARNFTYLLRCARRRRQAIIWTSAGILLTKAMETNFSEILIGIQTFSFTKMHLKMSSSKRRLFCLGPNVLTNIVHVICVSCHMHYGSIMTKYPLLITLIAVE